jgi:hypothetical protein
LREWGHGAHIAGPVGRIEGKCLGEALVHDPVRSRIADLLKKYHRQQTMNPELHVCEGCEKSHLSSRRPRPQEAIDAILAFEQCYQIVLLGSSGSMAVQKPMAPSQRRV